MGGMINNFADQESFHCRRGCGDDRSVWINDGAACYRSRGAQPLNVDPVLLLTLPGTRCEDRVEGEIIPDHYFDCAAAVLSSASCEAGPSELLIFFQQRVHFSSEGATRSLGGLSALHTPRWGRSLNLWKMFFLSRSSSWTDFLCFYAFRKHFCLINTPWSTAWGFDQKKLHLDLVSNWLIIEIINWTTFYMILYTVSFCIVSYNTITQCIILSYIKSCAIWRSSTRLPWSSPTCLKTHSILCKATTICFWANF